MLLEEAATNGCGGTAWYTSLLQLPTKEKEMVGNGTLSQTVYTAHERETF